MSITDELRRMLDELRRMLDERGVRWKGYGYENHTWWGEWHAENRASVNGLFVKVEALLTPAQAIEASLGYGEYERKMDELLCRLTNGKFSKTRTYDLDFMESVVREEFETDAATLGDADLAAENAKLRTLLGGKSIVTDYWKDEDGTMHVLTTDGEQTYEYTRGGLADENAKLRELVRDMYEMAYPEYPSAFDAAFADRMRELGVEVD